MRKVLRLNSTVMTSLCMQFERGTWVTAGAGGSPRVRECSPWPKGGSKKGEYCSWETEWTHEYCEYIQFSTIMETGSRIHMDFLRLRLRQNSTGVTFLPPFTSQGSFFPSKKLLAGIDALYSIQNDVTTVLFCLSCRRKKIHVYASATTLMTMNPPLPSALISLPMPVYFAFLVFGNK